MSRGTKKPLAIRVKPAADIAESLKYTVISDRTVNFSKKRAYDYLELPVFQGERQVNENHVQFLYNEFCGGRFMWSHVILALCECDGRTFRINGQHTSWMRVNIGDDYFISKGEEPRIREICYKVQDEDQMRALYSTFDRNKQRSAGHVFKSLLAGTTEATDIWASSMSCLGSGMKVWLFEKHNRMQVSANDLAELAKNKYQTLFTIVGLFLQKHWADAVFPRRAAVVAALFATFDKNVEKATEFWEPVVTGLALTEKSDPRYALRNFLQTHTQSSGSKTTAKGEVTSQEDTYRIAISCWNKWRKGQKILGGLRVTEERQKAI